MITTDFSPAMLEAARRRGAALGLANVDYRVIDAERIELDADSVDGALCRYASASEDELVEHCRALIAGYKLPRSIAFHSEPLPKSGAGKVLKRELREPYWAGQERQVS
jgi:acyl-CoA synthetase (AMP-forming)/AMP-acid ligase II